MGVPVGSNKGCHGVAGGPPAFAESFGWSAEVSLLVPGRTEAARPLRALSPRAVAKPTEREGLGVGPQATK